MGATRGAPFAAGAVATTLWLWGGGRLAQVYPRGAALARRYEIGLLGFLIIRFESPAQPATARLQTGALLCFCAPRRPHAVRPVSRQPRASHAAPCAPGEERRNRLAARRLVLSSRCIAGNMCFTRAARWGGTPPIGPLHAAATVRPLSAHAKTCKNMHDRIRHKAHGEVEMFDSFVRTIVMRTVLCPSSLHVPWSDQRLFWESQHAHSSIIRAYLSHGVRCYGIHCYGLPL